MIGLLIDALVAALDALTGTGELLDGIATVQAGDEMPRETADHPLVTVDLLRDPAGVDGYQTGDGIEAKIELACRLYVCSLPKGNSPARAALDLYWSSSAGAQAGLKLALRQIKALTVEDTKFVLSVGDTRPIRKSTQPQGRWTYGLEVPLVARAFVGRQ